MTIDTSSSQRIGGGVYPEISPQRAVRSPSWENHGWRLAVTLDRMSCSKRARLLRVVPGYPSVVLHTYWEVLISLAGHSLPGFPFCSGRSVDYSYSLLSFVIHYLLVGGGSTHLVGFHLPLSFLLLLGAAGGNFPKYQILRSSGCLRVTQKTTAISPY